MAVQEVGVRAIFETSTFTAGLNRYIAGLDKANKKTEEIVAAINAMAASFNQQEQVIGQGAEKAAQALNKITTAAKDAMQAVKDARSASSDTSGEDQMLSDLQRQLEVQRQIKQEIKDRVSQEKAILTIRSPDTSGLSKQSAEAELEMIRLFRELRDIGAPKLEIDPAVFDEIRRAVVDVSDLGNATKNTAKDTAADLRLISEAIRDRVRNEQIINELQNTRLTALQRERLELEQQTIALASQSRFSTATHTGADDTLLQRLKNIQNTPVQQADIGGISADETRLRVNRLLTQEIRDRIRIQQIDDQLASGQTSILQSNLLALEKQNIALNQQQRLNSELLSQEDQEAIARLRAVAPSAADLGKSQSDALRDQVTQLSLIQAELNAQLELKRLSLVLTNDESTAFDKEQASIARATLELEAQQRILAATKVGLSQQALSDVKRVAITPKDLGTQVEQTDPLQKAVQLNQLIQNLLQNRVALQKAIDDSQNQELSDIQRTTAALQAGNLVLQQQQKLAEFTKLGGDPAQVQAVNALLISSADLNVNVNAELEKQIGAQRLLLEEVAARVELERQNLILNDSASSALQRQAATMRILTLEAEAQVRTQKASDVGVGTNQLESIRSTAVETRDLGDAQKQTTESFKGLSAAAAVQIGILTQFTLNAVQGFIQGVRQMGSAVIDTVADFERLGLGISFFAAKTKFGVDSALSYQQRLAGVKDEATGLQFWLQKLAVASPFTTQEVEKLFRTTQAYGLMQSEAETLVPLMLDMAAAGGLDSDVLERLGLAMGQVRARGKLTGEEIRQLGNSGVPIRDILVSALGIANDQFDKLVESGALTSDIVIPAIIKGLKQFQGAGEAVAFGTIGGLVSSLKDLQQIATAKFFGAALDPLKDSFKSFFDLLNKPSTLATVTVLGEELGKGLVVAFQKLSLAVKETIKWVGALNPDLVAQAVTFVGVTAAIFTLLGAFGLMVVAINLLTNPIVGLTLLSAFLITEWTRMWSGLISITAKGVSTVTGFLGDLSTFGAQTAVAWGKGFASAAHTVTELARSIGVAISNLFEPHSPPKILPHIDKWGRDTAQIWLDAFAEANPETPLNKLGDVVSTQLLAQTKAATKKSLDAFNAANPEFQVNVGVGVNEATKKLFGIEIPKSITDAIPAQQKAASDAGIAASEAYVNAFGSLVPKFHAKIDPELTQALADLGGGAQLTQAGAQAFTGFLKGFKAADFSALDDAVGVVDSTLRGLVQRGAITEGDSLRGLFAAREDIASALREFRQLGSISQATLAKIVDSSGQAGNSVRDLLVAYTQFARADDILTSAQKKLTDITDKYNAILKPIKDSLERISELRQQSDEDQQIASLKRLIANEDVSEFRKQNARLKIAEIQQQRQVRGIEDEQKAQTDTAQATIDAAQKKQAAAQTNLELVKAQIQAQQDQMGLFNQEAELVKKLKDQVDQLTKKQMTDLDLQEKLVELRAAELDDNKKAAKAKFTLNQADSSQLEKQSAIFDLQNVAISRQQRLIEARDLGIPPEQLTSLRDMAVTLDDIGQKSDLGLGDGLDGLSQAEVDAKEEAAKWNKELETARTNIDNIKIKLGEMFDTINRNLPSWLQIFPTEKGGNPPILDTLTKYRDGIVLVGAAIIAWKVVSGILGMAAAIKAVTVAAGGGAAAGAGELAGGAAGGGAVGALLGFAGTLVAITPGVTATALEVWGLVAAFKAFQASQVAGAAQNTVNEEKVKGPSSFPIDVATAVFTQKVGKSPQASKDIGDAINFTVVDGLNNHLDTASIGLALQNQLNLAVSQGMIADTPENHRAIDAFFKQIEDIITTQGAGTSLIDGVKVSVPVTATPVLPPDNRPWWQQLSEILGLGPNLGFFPDVPVTIDPHFLDGINNKETRSTFATAMASLIHDAALQGMNNTDISQLVFGAFNAGVTKGLVADTPENDRAIQAFISGIVSQMRTKGEIKSPSGLTRREVGLPMGDGVLGGISDSLLAQAIPTGLVNVSLNILVASMKGTLFGLDGQRPHTLGVNWVAGLATGMADEVKALTSARLPNFQSWLQTSLFGPLTLTNIKGVNYTYGVAWADGFQKAISAELITLGARKQPDFQSFFKDALFGATKGASLPFLFGQTWMTALADGLRSQQTVVASALTDSLQFALASTQNLLTLTSPQAAAGALFANSPVASRASQIYPSGTTIINNIKYFNLTVQSAAQSQGIIRDFAIMETMES